MVVDGRVERLRSAAEQLRIGWVPRRWERVDEAGRDPVEMVGATFPRAGAAFVGLAPRPGGELALRCELDLPDDLGGAGLVGDALEVAVDSIYPLTMSHGGRELLDERMPTVATGPALVRVLDEIKPDGNGALELRIRFPDHQLTPWVRFQFTTPRIRRRHELIDVALARLELGRALARTGAERASLDAAARLVPDDPSRLGDDELDSFVARSLDALLPFEDQVSNLRVHCVGHSHIDMNWLWTWQDTEEVIRRDFRSVLAMMRAYPELTFVHSQPVTYDVIRRSDPELFSEVCQRIAEGRWEPATLQWVECDTNMVAGEAMVRQLLEAVTFTRACLGRDPTVLLAPDTFGHSGNLPQLASSAGARVYYHHRCNPAGGGAHWPAYWWEGQDGSRLLAVSTSRYSGNISAGEIAAAARDALGHGLTASLHLYGVGDHGGGPVREDLESLRRLRELPLLPRPVPSTIERYAGDVVASGVPLPVHRGESPTIFEGCYTTHADAKNANRAGENLLLTAESIGALAGQAISARLIPAWRRTLFNQFHDIIDGSAIAQVYEGVRADLDAVIGSANEVLEEALEVLEAAVSTGSIAVTNQLGWRRRDVVVVRGWPGDEPVELVGSHGHVAVGQPCGEGLCFIAEVPAFATVAYDPRPMMPEGAATATRVDELGGVGSFELAAGTQDEGKPLYVRVETALFAATIRLDSGIITSFVDKRVDRELVAFGMRRQSDYLDTARADLALNVFQMVHEHPHGMSAWHLDEVYSERSLLRGAGVRVVESGPVRTVLEVVHEPTRSTIGERILLYQDLDYVDVDATVDWHEPAGPEDGVANLKLAFTVDVDGGRAWFESPFAAAARNANGQETPALRWAAVDGEEHGFAVLNDGRYGHDVLGGRLRVTLARTAYEPDADSDSGRHEVGLRLMPYEGDWREAEVPRRAAEFNQPLVARLVGPGDRQVRTSPSSWRPKLDGSPSVVCSCFKTARDGSGLVLRFYESCGRAGRMLMSNLPAGSVAWETDVVEGRIRRLEETEGRVELTLGPWQVRTVLIETRH